MINIKHNYYKKTKELCTIQDMIRWAITQFNASDLHYGHGTNNSIDEALKLILPSLYLSLDIPKELLSSNITNNERKLITNRIFNRINKRIPVSYLTNKAWFCGHELYVDQRVLIPRSPIAELISKNIKDIINCEPKYILDMCTGSGCIAIACAYKFPNSQIDAVDISMDALKIAEKNINDHKLSQKITLLQSDLFQNLSPTIKYDIIITNPPYVKNEDMKYLPPEYLTEPKIALIAGHDGLIFIKKILLHAPKFLKKNAILICEVGNNMSKLIKKYSNINFKWLDFKNGGYGVFVLTYQQCCNIRKLINLEIKKNKTF